MSYDLKIFRNEVRLQSRSLDFLDNEENVIPFTEKQKETLKKRLKHYKYQLESKNDLFEEYNYDGGKLEITVLLTNNCLTFKCARGDQDGLFEILQTASEFGEGDLSVLNLQEGTWEYDGETYQIGQQPDVNASEIKTTATKIPEDEATNNTNSTKPWWKFW